MGYIEKKPAVLLLQDGTVFYGHAAGAIGTTTGEICFNTGMTGYQEIFTDPSYYRQVLVATHVHIGNYGIHSEEVESDGIRISGLVCRGFNVTPSRKNATESIQDYFTRQSVVAICDIDTRAVVRHVRNRGAMNCIISSETIDIPALKEQLEAVPSMAGLELSSAVTTSKPYTMGNPSAPRRIAVMDYGVKKNILRNLVSRDNFLQIFPANTSYRDVRSWNPEGIMLSNGPGDPSVMPTQVEEIRQMLHDNLPLFGICLGHQLLAEACGISTFKMFNGHRGINHPVKNLITGRSEITSQNHGFSVNADEVKAAKHLEITHVNLNDGTIEGIRVKDRMASSVQYHPEAAPGPHDSAYLFDDFIRCIDKAVVES